MTKIMFKKGSIKCLIIKLFTTLSLLTTLAPSYMVLFQKTK